MCNVTSGRYCMLCNHAINCIVTVIIYDVTSKSYEQRLITKANLIIFKVIYSSTLVPCKVVVLSCNSYCRPVFFYKLRYVHA